jgi:hypothetical protein
MNSWRSLEADIRRASPAFGPCRRNWKPRGLYWTSISGKIIKEMPGSVTSETPCIMSHFCTSLCISCRLPKCNIRYSSQKILMRLLQCRNKSCGAPLEKHRFNLDDILLSRFIRRDIRIKIHTIIILCTVLHECETWHRTLREKSRLRTFESGVLGA